MRGAGPSGWCVCRRTMRASVMAVARCVSVIQSNCAGLLLPRRWLRRSTMQRHARVEAPALAELCVCCGCCGCRSARCEPVLSMPLRLDPTSCLRRLCVESVAKPDTLWCAGTDNSKHHTLHCMLLMMSLPPTRTSHPAAPRPAAPQLQRPSLLPPTPETTNKLRHREG